MITPLQSGTDLSDSGFNRSISADRARIRQHIAGNGQVHASRDGRAMLVSAAYPPFEGEIDNGPFLRLALATGSATRLVQHVGGAKLEGLWRPGTLSISPPRSRGIAKVGETSTIGFALLPSGDEIDLDLDHVTALAHAFQGDKLIISVITALHCEAMVHGASTAFFDEGKALILRRLSELRGSAPSRRKVYPLSDARYRRVLEYVEDRLAYDLPISRLARVAGLDNSGFTRAMRARTGLTPYAWLTEQRMKRARSLLQAGMSVTDVATMSGYANPGKFSAAFKRVTGFPPSTWKW